MQGKRIPGGRRSALAGGRWLVFFVVLLGLVLAVPVAFAAEPGDPETPAAESAPAPTPAELAPIEKEEREYAEWLESPTAERQRENSQTAYTDLSAGEARSLLSETFAEELEGLNGDPGRILSTLEVEKPLGTYSALVKAPDGNSAILTSSAPLQSELGGEGNQQVDLTLEPSGQGFVPTNPLEEVELPGSAGESIHLEGGIEIKLPAGADPAAERLGSMNLFYPETATDTDTLVAPRANGVEVFEQLRSPQSPEELRFDMSLPEGAKLRPAAHGSGAEVVSGAGSELMEVTPPTAADAQGTPVPVTMNVEGDSLILDVPHRSADVAYPILVDPNYVNNTTNFSEWLLGPGNYSGYYMQSVPGSLDAFSWANTTYPEWSSANWVYGAVNQTTYIAAATFSSIYFLANGCNTENPHGYVGIYNTAKQSFEGHFGNFWFGNSSNASWESGWVGGYDTRQAMIGIGTYGEARIGCNHELFVGGYSIQEEDPYAPSFSSITGIPAAGSWFDPSAAGNASITAADNGLGVQEIAISDGGGTTTHPLNCSGASGSRCPTSNSWTVAPPYVEGEKTLVISSHDPVGNSTSWTRTTKADGTAPSASVTASQTATTLNAKVESTDGVSGNARSGVKEVKVYLDKTLKETRTNSCSTSGCPFTLNFTYSQALKGLAAGSHTVEAIAFDQLNHQRIASATFTLEAPNTVIDSGPEGLTNNNTPKFTYHSTQEGSTFQCSIDGGVFASCAATGYTTPKLADGEHTFSVAAVNGAGIADPTPATRSFTVDATPPDTVLEFGPSGLVAIEQPDFGYSSPTDPETAQFECRLDAAAFEACDEEEFFPENPLPDGAHSFEVRAVDLAGNVDPSPATTSFTVDSTSPVVEIKSGPTGPTSNPSPTFGFEASGGTVSCGIETVAPEFKEPTFGPCTSGSTYTVSPPLADGSYVFIVSAEDAAENETSDRRSFTVDTVAPNTTIVSGPEGTTDNPKPNFSFSSSEDNSTFLCRYDSAAFAACSGPGATHVPATALSDGSHTFQVKAVDAAGTADGTPASRTFSVLTTGPQTTIESGPGGAIEQTKAVFTYSANKTSTFQCSLDGAAFTSCGSSKEVSGLAQGEHRFEVRASSGGVTDPTPARRDFIVDTSAPAAPTVSGPLTEPSKTGLTLEVEASDGGSSPASSVRSGIGSIRVKVDGNTVATVSAPCTQNACPATAKRTIQLAPQDAIGTHHYAVEGIDGLGHVSAAREFDETASQSQELYARKSGSCTDGQVLRKNGAEIFGTECSETIIVSGSGKHKVFAYGGNDTILGSPGPDEIHGGPGNDFIRGRRSNDKNIYGEEGNDVIYGGVGDDGVVGGEGNDILDGGPGADGIEGQEGDDLLRGGQGENGLRGGPGEDTFSFVDAVSPGFRQNPKTGFEGFPGKEPGVYINLPAGTADGGSIGQGGQDDTNSAGLQLNDQPERVVGSPFADYIIGTTEGEKIDGGPGADLIEGRGGSDQITSDSSDLVVPPTEPNKTKKFQERNGPEIGFSYRGADASVFSVGTDKRDVMEARVHATSVQFVLDTVEAAKKYTLKNCGRNEKTINCRFEGSKLGVLSISGDSGADSLSISGENPEGPGTFLLYGGRNADTLHGGGGEDLLADGTKQHGGTEHLRGGGGDDALLSGQGADVMEGGPGGDLLISGSICRPGDAVYGTSSSGGQPESDNAQFRFVPHKTRVYADLEAETLGQVGGHGGHCTDGKFETLSNVSILEGSDWGDVFKGSKGTNLLLGRGGADEMLGRNGIDKLTANDQQADRKLNCGGDEDKATKKKDVAVVDPFDKKVSGCPEVTEEAESEYTARPWVRTVDGNDSLEFWEEGNITLSNYFPLDDQSGTAAANRGGGQAGTYEAAGTGPSVNGPGPMLGAPGALTAVGNPDGVELDGVDDYVDLGSQGAPPAQGGYSVAGFFKFAKAPTEREFLFSAGDVSGGAFLYREPNGKIVFASGLNPGAPEVSSPPLTDTGWHHLAGTLQGETISLYVDGFPYQLGYGSNVVLNSAGAGQSAIGAGPGPAHFFAGTAAAITTYRGAMNVGQVTDQIAESRAELPELLPALPAEADSDGDGVGDGSDNCVSVPNPDQADSDMNGEGDACDPPDSDGDGISDAADNCPSSYNPDQADANGDGIGDACAEVPPDVTTASATEVKGTSAVLNGSVNPEAQATTYQFEYGLTTAYGSVVPTTAKSAGSGASAVAASETLSNLSPSTTYHFRIVATNATGQTYGEDQTFTTLKLATATTQAATGIKSTSATLNGSVNPEGAATEYQFSYGTTTSYGSKAPASPVSVGSGIGPVLVNQTVSGLQPNTTYHFRVEAISKGETVRGKDLTFKTPSPPVTGAQIAGMPVTDAFDGSSGATNTFSTSFGKLGWAAEKGVASIGWGPSAAFPSVAGAYYSSSFSDTGSGVAAAATVANNPELTERYFSLWLDMSSPTGTSRSGYELRFLDTSTNSYTVTLAKWVAGTQIVLATKSAYGLVNGNSIAIVDQGSTVSAWTNSGSGFNQILSAEDGSFTSGYTGFEASGNFTRLTNFKAGVPSSTSGMNAALSSLELRDSFARNENPLSLSGSWEALSWDNAVASKTGHAETGWGPLEAFPAVSGAYWTKASFSGGIYGTAVAAIQTQNPTISERYFSLWLDMSGPASAKSGYELRFTETGTALTYEVALSKWVSGTKTVLATKAGYSLPVGSAFALVAKAGTVSAWTKTGSEYAQLLSASDSTFNSGYLGLEGAGNILRLSEFKGGQLAPF